MFIDDSVVFQCWTPMWGDLEIYVFKRSCGGTLNVWHCLSQDRQPLVYWDTRCSPSATHTFQMPLYKNLDSLSTAGFFGMFHLNQAEDTGICLHLLVEGNSLISNLVPLKP